MRGRPKVRDAARAIAEVRRLACQSPFGTRWVAPLDVRISAYPGVMTTTERGRYAGGEQRATACHAPVNACGPPRLRPCMEALTLWSTPPVMLGIMGMGREK